MASYAKIKTSTIVLRSLTLIALVAVSAGLCLKLYYSYRYKLALREITEFLPRKEAFHDTVDAVRRFVHERSKHGVGPELYAIWKTPHLVARKLLDSPEDGGPLPMLECSARSKITSDLLEHFGFQTRKIYVFDDDTPDLQSHTFLDVRSPDTGKWETVDPDYNIWWADAATGDRISIADQAEDVTKVVPCDGKTCSWDLVNREGARAAKLKDYLDIVVIVSAEHRTTYFTSSGDPAKTFVTASGSGTFCDLNAKHCRDGVERLSSR